MRAKALFTSDLGVTVSRSRFIKNLAEYLPR